MPQLLPPPRQSKTTLQNEERIHARFFFWAMVILTGWLLFAHGCHGDEDNELFTAITRTASCIRPD